MMAQAHARPPVLRLPDGGRAGRAVVGRPLPALPHARSAGSPGAATRPTAASSTATDRDGVSLRPLPPAGRSRSTRPGSARPRTRRFWRAARRRPPRVVLQRAVRGRSRPAPARAVRRRRRAAPDSCLAVPPRGRVLRHLPRRLEPGLRARRRRRLRTRRLRRSSADGDLARICMPLERTYSEWKHSAFPAGRLRAGVRRQQAGRHRRAPARTATCAT